MISPLKWQEPTAYTKAKVERDGKGVLVRILNGATYITLNREGIYFKQGLRSGLRRWYEVLYCQFLTDTQNGVVYTVLALYNDLGREFARYALGAEVTQAQITALLQQIGKDIREEQVEQAEQQGEASPEPPRPPLQPEIPLVSTDVTLMPTQFSALVHQEMEEWAVQQGFQKKSAGTLAWIRQEGEEYLQFWIRISPLGTNLFAGSSFQVLLQRSTSPQTNSQLSEGTRQRLTESLNAEELEQVRALQNEVITCLPVPPPDFGQPKVHESLLAYLKEQFQPIEAGYTPQSDIWFRYRTQQDVRLWMEMLREWLSRIW